MFSQRKPTGEAVAVAGVLHPDLKFVGVSVDTFRRVFNVGDFVNLGGFFVHDVRLPHLFPNRNFYFHFRRKKFLRLISLGFQRVLTWQNRTAGKIFLPYERFFLHILAVCRTICAMEKKITIQTKVSPDTYRQARLVATGANIKIADVLRAGLSRVLAEYRSTGKITLGK